MKIKNLFKVLTALAFMVSVSSYADAFSDRSTLRDKLEFRYVPDPNKSASEMLNNVEIFNGTETGDFWKNNTMSVAQKLVRSLLCNSKNGGDASLQYYAAKIIKIINKPVLVLLYDDSSTLTHSAVNIWSICLDNPNTANPKVWPCAGNQSLVDDEKKWSAQASGKPVPTRFDDRRSGFIHLGIHYMKAQGLSWAKSTFLHELVHTQDLSNSRFHLFGVNGIDYGYGSDRTHYFEEVIPDMAWSYKEGIANTISFLYDTNWAKQSFKWFSSNGELWVEINTTPGKGASKPDTWLYDQIIASGAKAKKKANGYAQFKIRDLFPKFIIHNEIILALIFSKYARYTSLNTFMKALRASNNKLWRVSASGIALLFENMCRAGLPDGVTLDDLSRMSVDAPQKYLLPLAYADYFTAFRSQNKKDFSAIFEDMLPQAWIDLYWDTARDTVKKSFSIDKKPNFNDLADIAIALGINRSTPD